MEISHDVDAVLVGLSQFKNELLQLHALGRWREGRRDGEGRERGGKREDKREGGRKGERKGWRCERGERERRETVRERGSEESKKERRE